MIKQLIIGGGCEYDDDEEQEDGEGEGDDDGGVGGETGLWC